MKSEDLRLEIEVLRLMFSSLIFVRDIRTSINPTWFSSEAIGWMVSHLIRLGELGRHPSPNMVVSAASRTRGLDKDILAQLEKICGLVSAESKVISVERGREACKEILEMWKIRRISNAVVEVAELADGGRIDEAEDEIASLKMDLDSSLTGTMASGEFFADIPIREEQIQAKRDRPDEFSGVPIGIRDLDEKIGMIGNGNLGVVFGYTQSGKSMSLRSIGIMGWMKGRNVVHITLEDSMSIVQNSYDCLMLNRFNQMMFEFTGQNRYDFPDDRMELEEALNFRKEFAPIYGDFKKGLSKSQEAKWKRGIETLSGACPHNAGIYIIEMREYSSIDEIYSRIDALPDRPGLIVVDYANLISTSGNSNDPLDWKSQAVVIGKFHTMSKTIVSQGGRVGVPVWVACQSHKDVEKKSVSRVDLSNVTGVSYLIVQPPDICLYIRDCRQVKVLKSRDSEVGEVFRTYPDFERKDLLDPLTELRETGKIYTTRM